MSMPWNVKFASLELQAIMLGAAMFFYGKTHNKYNKKAVLVYICWTIFDALAYIYNYKTFDYWMMYLFLGIIIFLVNVGKEFRDYLWNISKPPIR